MRVNGEEPSRRVSRRWKRRRLCVRRWCIARSAIFDSNRQGLEMEVDCKIRSGVVNQQCDLRPLYLETREYSISY